MNVQVIKDGKEHNQGVAYLDDGTMIVVEEGRNYIGKHIDVLVTSVLQTAAGRMIFAKPKELSQAAWAWQKSFVPPLSAVRWLRAHQYVSLYN
jgi:hypothetical protein